MAKNSQDELARAYAILSALRKNIDKMTEYSIEEKYVKEFHNVLDKLESVGIETADFRIPDSMVKPKITSSWMEGGISHHRYSDEKYVERTFILTKIDAILGYFEFKTSDKPKKMGFHKAEE